MPTLPDRPREVLDVLPAYDELPDGAIVSSSSVTLPGKQRGRLLLERKTVVIDGEQETEPAFARAWLAGLGQRRARGEQIEAATRAMYTIAPHWVSRPEDGDYVLIDLRAAFLQVFTRVCWDLEYRRGGVRERYFCPGSGRAPLAEWPYGPGYKTMYASVISNSFPTGNLTMVKDGRPFGVNVPNRKRSNPQLVTFVGDVLHALAWYAVRAFQACRVNTDSYLVRAREQDALCAFLEDLQLTWRVKGYGPVRLRHLNAYEVGELQSEPFEQAHGEGRPLSNLELDQAQSEWLLKHFRSLPRTYQRLTTE